MSRLVVGLLTLASLALLFPATVQAVHLHSRVRHSVTLEVVLDYDTIKILLESQDVDERLLQRLEAHINDVEYKVQNVDSVVRRLPGLLAQQTSASRVIELEDYLRNRLEDYSLILKNVRSLHLNGSRYDNETFHAKAGSILTHLDSLLADVAANFPNWLRSLDRNLQQGGQGSTEGLLCDAAVNALDKLESSHNLTSSVKEGPLAILEALIALQTSSTDLYYVTCPRYDDVCLARVAEFRQNPELQRSRLRECIPPWVLMLVENDVISGRLSLLPEKRALTKSAVYHIDQDKTYFYPELQQARDELQQLVEMRRRGTYYYVIIGDKCFLRLHNEKDFSCSGESTNQGALFAVETSRDGSTWLWNVQTQRYLVAGETQERCREGVLALSQQRGSPWTFDSSFRPGTGGGQEPRQCILPAATQRPDVPNLDSPADTSHSNVNLVVRGRGSAAHSQPGPVSCLLPIVSLAVSTAWAKLSN